MYHDPSVFRTRFLSTFSAVGLILLSFSACQDEARKSLTAPQAATATVRGTLVAGDDQPGVAPGAPLAGVRVTVASAGRSTASDAAGNFALVDLPAGSIRLDLENATSRAGVPVAAPPRSVVTVTIAVSRHSATIVSHDAGSEIEGVVQSITGTSLTVLDQHLGKVTVNTDASTIIRRHDAPAMFSDIKVGTRIEAKGTRQSDVTFLATSIQIEDEPQNEAEVSGTISSLSSPSFKVHTPTGDVMVTTDGKTLFVKNGQPATFADLKVGSRVEVHGTRQTDGTILAARVQIEDETGEQDEAEVEGTIKSLGTDSFDLSTKAGTVTVHTNAMTKFEGPHDTMLAFTDLKVGIKVDVEGTRQADMSILAKKVQIED